MTQQVDTSWMTTTIIMVSKIKQYPYSCLILHHSTDSLSMTTASETKQERTRTRLTLAAFSSCLFLVLYLIEEHWLY